MHEYVGDEWCPHEGSGSDEAYFPWNFFTYEHNDITIESYTSSTKDANQQKGTKINKGS